MPLYSPFRPRTYRSRPRRGSVPDVTQVTMHGRITLAMMQTMQATGQRLGTWLGTLGLAALGFEDSDS
jgi:hypothetical protein